VLRERAVQRIVRPYGRLLSTVVHEAWTDWQSLAADGERARIRSQIGASARAFNVHDFMKSHARRRLNGVRGIDVDSEGQCFDLSLAGGELQLALGRVRPEFPRSRPRTRRQRARWYQVDATPATLLEGAGVTYAKLGYVLDATETAIASVVLGCWVQRTVLWCFALPAPVLVTATPGIVVPTNLTSAAVPTSHIASARPRAQLPLAADEQ
jgi:hypothetical protein